MSKNRLTAYNKREAIFCIFIHYMCRCCLKYWYNDIIFKLNLFYIHFLFILYNFISLFFIFSFQNRTFGTKVRFAYVIYISFVTDFYFKGSFHRAQNGLICYFSQYFKNFAQLFSFLYAFWGVRCNSYIYCL